MSGKLGERLLFSREVCPNLECSSKRRVYEETAKIEAADGKIRPEVVDVTGELATGVIWDPTKAQVLMVPTILVVSDYCLDCGEKYVKRILRITVPKPEMPTAQMGPALARQQGRGGPPDILGFNHPKHS